jgi:hypothetical protein
LLIATGSLVLACAIALPARAVNDGQIQACRNQVIAAYPGTQAFNVGITEVSESNGTVRLNWFAGNNRQGQCTIGPRNEVLQFINNGHPMLPQPGGPWGGPGANPIPNTQNFGDVPGIGQFAAIHNSGRFANGVVSFEAYVNGGGPFQFGATCASGHLSRSGAGSIHDSAQARYVVAYVCNGGPPSMNNNGKVGFGQVPGLGQFNVVNGSGTSGGPGVVAFQAFVNGAGPSMFLAQCATGRISQNGKLYDYSPQSQYAVSYICNGGPPGGAWYQPR